jgi:solute carrier family 25 S-adenosylmethionine transporter 26
MAGSFPGAATFWTAYETVKAIATPITGAGAAPLIAAAAADVAVVGIRNPFEVVKQQLQSGMHRSTRDAVRAILKSDGFAGFYAGYSSTVLREIPFDAIGESRPALHICWRGCTRLIERSAKTVSYSQSLASTSS